MLGIDELLCCYPPSNPLYRVIVGEGWGEGLPHLPNLVQRSHPPILFQMPEAPQPIHNCALDPDGVGKCPIRPRIVAHQHRLADVTLSRHVIPNITIGLTTLYA